MEDLNIDLRWPKEPGFYMQCGTCGFTEPSPGPEKKPDGKYIEPHERELYCRNCRKLGKKVAYTTFFNIPSKGSDGDD